MKNVWRDIDVYELYEMEGIIIINNVNRERLT